MKYDKILAFFLDKEILKYIIVGLVNTGLTAVIIYLCMLYGFDVYLSNALGYFFGVLISYFLNSIFTFKASLSAIRLIKFIVVCLFCWLLNILSIRVYLSFFYEGLYSSQIVGMVVYTLTGYIVNKLWVMK